MKAKSKVWLVMSFDISVNTWKRLFGDLLYVMNDYNTSKRRLVFILTLKLVNEWIQKNLQNLWQLSFKWRQIPWKNRKNESFYTINNYKVELKSKVNNLKVIIIKTKYQNLKGKSILEKKIQLLKIFNSILSKSNTKRKKMRVIKLTTIKISNWFRAMPIFRKVLALKIVDYREVSYIVQNIIPGIHST